MCSVVLWLSRGGVTTEGRLPPKVVFTKCGTANLSHPLLVLFSGCSKCVAFVELFHLNDLLDNDIRKSNSATSRDYFFPTHVTIKIKEVGISMWFWARKSTQGYHCCDQYRLQGRSKRLCHRAVSSFLQTIISLTILPLLIIFQNSNMTNMTCSWVVHELFITCSLLIHYLFTTCSHFVCDLFMSC